MKLKIFLTKSPVVANLLAKAHDVGKGNIRSTSSGVVGNDARIPSIYHGINMYFCAVEYESDRDEYELIIA